MTEWPCLKRVIVLGQRLFGPIAIVFLIFAAVSARARFVDAMQHARFMPLAATVVIWTLLHLLSPVFAWVVLAGTGSNISYGTTLRIHLARLPARYLPGGIWHTVSRMADLSRLGASRPQLSVLVILENALPPAIALALGSASLALAGKLFWLSAVGVSCGLILLAGVILLLRHRLLLNRQRFSFCAYMQLAALSTTFWICAATAFVCYWAALSNTSVGPAPLEIGGAYLLSWVAGFMAIFAPQGIGVFEASIGMLLKGAVPFSSIVVLAAGFRAAILLADALAYCIFLLSRLYLRLPRVA